MSARTVVTSAPRLVQRLVTHTFHPLHDRVRSRIASGLSVRRLPPLVITPLLIVRVILSVDYTERSSYRTLVLFKPEHGCKAPLKIGGAKG